MWRVNIGGLHGGETARRSELRDGDGSGLHHNALRGFQILLRAQDVWILL